MKIRRRYVPVGVEACPARDWIGEVWDVTEARDAIGDVCVACEAWPGVEN